MARGVHHRDPQPVAFGRLDRGAGDTTVVRPCREEDPGSNLDLFVGGHELVLPHGPAAAIPRHLASVEVGENVVGTEAVASVVHRTDGPETMTSEAIASTMALGMCRLCQHAVARREHRRASHDSGSSHPPQEPPPIHETHIASATSLERATGEPPSSTFTNSGPPTGPRATTRRRAPGRIPIEPRYLSASGIESETLRTVTCLPSSASQRSAPETSGTESSSLGIGCPWGSTRGLPRRSE